MYEYEQVRDDAAINEKSCMKRHTGSEEMLDSLAYEAETATAKLKSLGEAVRRTEEKLCFVNELLLLCRTERQ